MVMVKTEKYRIKKTGNPQDCWYVLEKCHLADKSKPKWSEDAKSQNYQEMLTLLKSKK